MGELCTPGPSGAAFTPGPSKTTTSMELCSQGPSGPTFTPGPSKTSHILETTLTHCMDLCTPAQKYQRLVKIRENAINNCTPALKPQRLVCESSPTGVENGALHTISCRN